VDTIKREILACNKIFHITIYRWLASGECIRCLSQSELEGVMQDERGTAKEGDVKHVTRENTWNIPHFNQM
jgi:hypothetical protein